jgi:histidinol-phosphate aminotransferase
MDIKSLITPHLEALAAYEPPDWQALADQAGVPIGDLIRLDANENPYGPSPRVAAALARFDGYGFYPDYGPLTAAVAGYAGVAPDQVVLGNGGDEIIDLAVRLTVTPGDGVVICPPAFGMYTVSSRAHRGQVLAVPRNDEFDLDVAGIEALVAEARPRLLFLTSPGNPDGQIVPPATVERLLALPLVVVVDEAYVEFGGPSCRPLLAGHANLIVLRTFSKWAGLAGLRLGYALASPQMAAALARLRPPYNVNAAAVAAALATLADMDHVQCRIGQIVAERERLQAALAGLPGLQPLPSQANFVLCRLASGTGRDLARALVGQGILVRCFADPALANTIRITVGRPAQNDALLAALAEILAAPVPVPAPPHASASPQPAPRRGHSQRRTGETDVEVELNLDGRGRCQADTGLGFLDHMLAQVAAHGLFDLEIRARGDLAVDEHHTVEDVAIGLGQALDAALGERRGLVRMGQAYAPLDEALAHVVVDLSGRPYAVIDASFDTERLGAVGTDLLIHFLETLAVHGRLCLHARLLYGRNDHHRAEALFKALGRALDAATRLDPRRQGVPSTKGVL